MREEEMARKKTTTAVVAEKIDKTVKPKVKKVKVKRFVGPNPRKAKRQAKEAADKK